MTTNPKAVAAPAFPSIGSNALTPSFSSIQRNRGNRFSVDLSSANVVDILLAYEAKQRKAKPNYSMQPVIKFIEDIEEAERVAAETTIMPDGSRAEWAGPFQPIDICADFWVAFEIFYVNTPGQYGKKRHASGCETYANKIIAALAWSQAYGVKLDPTFREKNFGRYKKKRITPTHDQISLIYHYDLDVKENRERIRALAEKMKLTRFSFALLRKVRDHFVLSCSLGQRISDSKRIDPSHFSGTVYETTQQKTGNHARVDVQVCAIDWDVVKEILERYDYHAPAYGVDTGNYNKFLHLLCRAIGGPFDRVVTWEYKESGEIFRESAPVWQLMTSHVARRTFITNEIQRGKPMPEIMRESGHADARNMNTYYVPDSH